MVVAGVVVAMLAGAAPAARAAWTPLPLTFLRGLQRSFGDSAGSPPGANNWKCQPSAAHPRPAVLVHGTAGSMNTNMGALSSTLSTAGYCVFALNYGGPPQFGGYLYGMGPVRQSAKELGGFVDKVLGATHATQVDIIGHSQGGMMPRWYLKFLGGAAKVHTLIGISPSNHGTQLGSFPGPKSDSKSSDYCAACTDQAAGSPFLTQLNAGGDTLPGVDYTVIETRYDEVVVPYSSAFLTGPRVTNILLQHLCPLDFSDHLNTAFDPITLALVKNALDPAHKSEVPCRLVVPPLS